MYHTIISYHAICSTLSRYPATDTCGSDACTRSSPTDAFPSVTLHGTPSVALHGNYAESHLCAWALRNL